MVFKVKQRARNVYANITEDITDNKISPPTVTRRETSGRGTRSSNSPDVFIEQDHTYSYNWPYDYCSLVELARFEAGIEIKG